MIKRTLNEIYSIKLNENEKIKYKNEEIKCSK
jgi:hypothetical protein